MTQPVSPEDALKALVEAIWAVRQPPPNDAYMLKMVMSHDTAVAIAKAVLNTRTDPPKTVLDEEVVRALTITTEALDIALGPWDGAGKVNGIKLIADTRALLIRLKDRGTD